MRAADFSGVNVSVGVRLKLTIPGAIDRAGKMDPAIRGRLEPLDVFLRIRRVAYNQKPLLGRDFFKGFNNNMGIILRFKPADIQKIVSWPHTELIQNSCCFGLFAIRAVDDHHGRFPIFPQVVIPNYLRIADDNIGNHGCKILREAVISPPGRPPFFPQAFDSVHI